MRLRQENRCAATMNHWRIENVNKASISHWSRGVNGKYTQTPSQTDTQTDRPAHSTTHTHSTARHMMAQHRTGPFLFHTRFVLKIWNQKTCFFSFGHVVHVPHWLTWELCSCWAHRGHLRFRAVPIAQISTFDIVSDANQSSIGTSFKPHLAVM